jgi:hypothetical protein
MPVFCYLLKGCRSTESRYILIFPGTDISPPGMIRPGYLLNILIGQFPVNPVPHDSHLPGVDKEDLSTTVPELSI